MRPKQSANGFSFISNGGSRLRTPETELAVKFELYSLLTDGKKTPQNYKAHVWFGLVWFGFLSFLLLGFSVALGFVCLCVAFFSLGFETDSASPALYCRLVLQFSLLSPESMAALSGLVLTIGLCGCFCHGTSCRLGRRWVLDGKETLSAGMHGISARPEEAF